MEVVSSKYKFESAKSFFTNGLANNQLDLDLALERYSNTDEIVKTAIEHSFRAHVLQHLNKMEIEDMKRVVDKSIECAQKKLCLPTTPIFLLNDMLCTLTIEKCSEIFCYLEDSSDVWKSDVFYASVKNYLLRMCNDLLKRLSKSQNTVFSGRIHLFLAKLFPLNEKSGLNLMSHFSDNTTRYTNDLTEFEEAINKNKSETMDTDESDDSKIHRVPIDFNLYTKFWSLQEFFGKPNTCFEKQSWKTFVSNANEVLEALMSYRLEEAKNEDDEQSASVSAATTVSSKLEDYDDMDLYFSKYLTSEKLLDLQLNDSNFRRQILIQFLILFQYLNTEVKFKTSSQVLSDDQATWIKQTLKKVDEILKQTPSNGSKFTKDIQRVLEREEIWNKWKNEGCPNYVKEKRPPPTQPPRAKRAKPLTSDFVFSSGHDKNKQQPAFLTPPPGSAVDNSIYRLFNINHDNLEACKDPDRQFLPSLREYFDEAFEQLDPANQIEKEYHVIYQADWAWKSLRLLAKRSSLYFMQNPAVKTISEYLETICSKLGKEFGIDHQKKPSSTSTTTTAATANTDEQQKDPITKQENEESQNGISDDLNEQQIEPSSKNGDEQMIDEDSSMNDTLTEAKVEPEPHQEPHEVPHQEQQQDEQQQENGGEPEDVSEETEEKEVETCRYNDAIVLASEGIQNLSLFKSLLEKLNIEYGGEPLEEDSPPELITSTAKNILQTWMDSDEHIHSSALLAGALHEIGLVDLAKSIVESKQ